MLRGSVEEYKTIRDEMTTVKKCITDYVGFTVGSSGAAAVAMAILARSLPDNTPVIVMACLALSLLVTGVASIVFYKFNSHNRFAGYCKLLNHETSASPAASRERTLFSWEIVLERLRLSDDDIHLLSRLLQEQKDDKQGGNKNTATRYPKINIEDLPDETQLVRVTRLFVGVSPPVDKCKYIKGIWVLVKAFFGKISSRSWGFPPIPGALLAFLASAFLITAISLSAVALWRNPLSAQIIALCIATLVVVAVQFMVWIILGGKIHTVTMGSGTVAGFFWRYLPARAEYLNSLEITPRYYHLDNLISETLSYYNWVADRKK